MKKIYQLVFRFPGVLLFCILSFLLSDIRAQYFGRNKPQYDVFDYKVFETPDFRIYHYFDKDSMLYQYGHWTQMWYNSHQQVFKDTFDQKNPLILYKNHADFQQTNAVSSRIGVGTGGVTELLKNRMILPVTLTNAQTSHVLGHEMVHAFQFNLITTHDSLSSRSLGNFPLWFVEGMSEYLSIGSIDAHTAMWMRDDLIHDNFPTLKEMTQYPGKYFPYRYGHAFWSMVAKVWGDTVIRPLFIETAKYGYRMAMDSVLGVSEETFSNMWKTTMKNYYSPYLTDTLGSPPGKQLFSKDNSGEINVTPSISPNGKYMVFLSERGVFSIDLYLAEVETGKVLKKLTSYSMYNEIDAFNYLESSGTWSPNGQMFAFVIFKKGENRLAIYDINKEKIKDQLRIPGVPAIYNPDWSPDGQNIIFSGLVSGYSDIYMYNLGSKKVTRLTDSYFGDIHPSWSNDGSKIVFSTEDGPRANQDDRKVKFPMKYSFNLAILDLKDREIKILDAFPGAHNLNPVFSPDDQSIYFLSNNDGFRNMYEYDLQNNEVYKMTDLPTGISGITSYAPAIDVATAEDLVVYS